MYRNENPGFDPDPGLEKKFSGIGIGIQGPAGELTCTNYIALNFLLKVPSMNCIELQQKKCVPRFARYSWEPGSQGAREPGGQGARGPGSQGAREPGSQGARESCCAPDWMSGMTEGRVKGRDGSVASRHP